MTAARIVTLMQPDSISSWKRKISDSLWANMQKICEIVLFSFSESLFCHFFSPPLCLQALNLEARELWKGYIRSVVEVSGLYVHLPLWRVKSLHLWWIKEARTITLQLAVPASINLLPGQIQTLKETVEKEEARINNASPPVVTNNAAPVSLQGDKPAWVLA